MNRIKTGDRVRVISGKYMGQEGVVLKVLVKENKCIIENINKVKIHKKPSAQQEAGGIIEKEAPIYLSKVALIAPKSPTGVSKIRYEIDKNNKKIRVAKKTKLPVGNGQK